ncbi:tRNA 2-thiouridine(34) synthase MnmA [Deltaproteobacteria bacterium Smac51]|nr:tRNA 2-thiouridine(34) synthase MnmA [Deltaproteobacteria bacterium Smac51]
MPPLRKKRVLVGMSGGVDSSVTAALLMESGYEVIGARMRVYNGPGDPALTYGCYGRDDSDDLKAAEDLARRLNIDFHIIDCTALYEEKVLGYFRDEYLAGRTPNPCIRCNQTVKFEALPLLAERQGLEFDFFATGHYARTEHSVEHGGPVLKRGSDLRKDQSYFLYRLSREQLGRTLFPLGEFTKEQVRAMAAERGFPVHNRPDSQDFYGGDYVALLNIPDRAGAIVDTSGRVLGRHQGFWRYTPGQRKGLGVPAAHPLYVLRVVPEENQVVVGPASEDSYDGCFIGGMNFFLPLPARGARLMARLRSAQRLREVIVGPETPDGLMRIDFAEPMSGLAPGQSLVMYQDDVVVGGGIIMR